MDYVSLGRRIRKERKSHHLTQEKLAERVGISLSFLGHIERGSRKASIETLVSIANALNASLDGLLQESLENLEVPKIEMANQKELLREINRMIETSLDSWNQ